MIFVVFKQLPRVIRSENCAERKTDAVWAIVTKNKLQLTILLSLEISYPQVIHLFGQKLVENTLFAFDRLML